MTNPYDSAYRDPDPDPLVDGGQGRTIDDADAAARVLEVCIVAGLLLAAMSAVVLFLA